MKLSKIDYFFYNLFKVKKKIAKSGCCNNNSLEILVDRQKMNKFLRVETNSLISFYREVLDRLEEYND
jgi:hypothetical protein